MIRVVERRVVMGSPKATEAEIIAEIERQEKEERQRIRQEAIERKEEKENKKKLSRYKSVIPEGKRTRA